MYKLLLSWRYLRTRYLALASIVSVMLGVATLIVVNSVMSGFSTKLRDRMRGIQAHVIVEYRSDSGFPFYEHKMNQLRQLAGDKIEAISPVIETFAVLQFQIDGRGEVFSRPIMLIGVDPETRSQVGDFGLHLQRPIHKADPAKCFDLDPEAQAAYDARYRRQQPWLRPEPLRRFPQNEKPTPPPDPTAPPPPVEPTPPPELEVAKPFGIILGHGIASYRDPESKPGEVRKDIAILVPGNRVTLMMGTSLDLPAHDGTTGLPRPLDPKFVVTGTFKCDMSEFDSKIAFIHIRDMQSLRAMQGRATHLHVRLKDYDRDAKQVVEKLRNSREFPGNSFIVQTWEEKQGTLLAAIAIERAILNVLLFLIIAVAGFGILAIFFTIVVEKTRDIGILKSLGASNSGVAGMFLGYGLFLGLVGAGLGTMLGVTITVYINEIEHFIAISTGQEVFPRDVYYFEKIPTNMDLGTILLVNAGAMLIAVMASVVPAIRAALLRPVQALRYE
jgi:lipoprotein-releasing system permease protein